MEECTPGTRGLLKTKFRDFHAYVCMVSLASLQYGFPEYMGTGHGTEWLNTVWTMNNSNDK